MNKTRTLLLMTALIGMASCQKAEVNQAKTQTETVKPDVVDSVRVQPNMRRYSAYDKQLASVFPVSWDDVNQEVRILLEIDRGEAVPAQDVTACLDPFRTEGTPNAENSIGVIPEFEEFYGDRENAVSLSAKASILYVGCGARTEATCDASCELITAAIMALEDRSLSAAPIDADPEL